MKISIKKMNTPIELKNNGIELEVRDTKGEFLGDLVVGRGAVIWCKGKTTPENGIKKKWKDVIAFFEENSK